MCSHLVCLLVSGVGLGVACDGGRGEPGGAQPRGDGPAVEGDEAVFGPLTAVISVSEVSSSLSTATTERARAVFTRTIAASGGEPPCNGWASVAHRLTFAP